MKKGIVICLAMCIVASWPGWTGGKDTTNAIVIDSSVPRDGGDTCVWECTPGEPCVIPVTCVGLMPVPLGSCDDASDCGDAIEETCKALGYGDADTVDFDKSGGKCSGTCDNGTGVNVACANKP